MTRCDIFFGYEFIHHFCLYPQSHNFTLNINNAMQISWDILEYLQMSHVNVLRHFIMFVIGYSKFSYVRIFTYKRDFYSFL